MRPARAEPTVRRPSSSRGPKAGLDVAVPVGSTLPLFAEPATPEGFRYCADLVTPKEESDLVERFKTLSFEPFDFRGFKGKRRTVAYGS